MYIAIVKRDTHGRKILINWEPYRMQEFGAPVTDDPDIFYSSLVLDHKVNPDEGTYEVKDNGEIVEIKDYTDTTSSDSTSLQYEKQKKITLVNQSFEQVVRQVLPVDYMAYRGQLELMGDSEDNEAVNWFMDINQAREDLIRKINSIEEIGDLDHIYIDFKGLDSERPDTLSNYDTPLGFTYETIKKCRLTQDIEVPSNSSSSVPLYTNKYPINGTILIGTSEEQATTWDNYAEESYIVTPTALLFRADDGTATSASQILQESTELPPDTAQVEITVPDNTRLRVLNLVLEKEDSYVDITTQAGTIRVRGKNLSVDMEANSSYIYVKVYESAFIGPLSITASTIAPEIKIMRSDLVSGLLTLNMYEYVIGYQVLNELGDAVYNGSGPGLIEDLVVEDDYALEVMFESTEIVQTMEWTLKPTVSTSSSYNVRLSYNELNNVLQIYNDNSLDLNGTLLFDLI
jgi:hypothetical protein